MAIRGEKPSTARRRPRKPVADNHTLIIPRDWIYSRAVNRRSHRVTYEFFTSETCRGLTLEISTWRLRPTLPETTGQPESMQALLLEAYAELERVLGDSAFPHVQEARQKARANEWHLQGLVRLAPDFDRRRRAFEEECAREMRDAFIQDLFSPRVGPLGIPLLSLTEANKSKVTVEKTPWPYAEPPVRLEHLATKGFASGTPYGILAYPPDDDAPWIVARHIYSEIEFNPETGIQVFCGISRLLQANRDLLQTLQHLPEILDAKNEQIRHQRERLAMVQQVIGSAVRTTLQQAEQRMVKKDCDRCLSELTDEEMLLFIFLIGGRYKGEKLIPFPLKRIAWFFDLGSQSPHGQAASRAYDKLCQKHPAIKALVEVFRVHNKKGGKVNRTRHISFDGMSRAERRRIGLDDDKDDESS